MDGIVVDLGHEMTQIVPIFGGMTDIRKAQTFKVGGITMDSILMKLWEKSSPGRQPMNQAQVQSKYIHYKTRTKFKEELQKLKTWDIDGEQADQNMTPSNSNQKKDYELPDGTNLDINWLRANW